MPSERRAASHRWSRCYLEAPSRRPLSAITQAPALIAGTSVDWDFEAPPWAVSGCARCASKTGDGRATSGCLREGYPTVRVVGEAIADVEQQYEVGMRAHAANAGVQEGRSKALAIICFGEDAAAKARKQAAADGGAIAAVVGGMRAHAVNARVQDSGSKALANICFGEDAAGKARKQAAVDANAIAAVVGGM